MSLLLHKKGLRSAASFNILFESSDAKGLCGRDVKDLLSRYRSGILIILKYFMYFNGI